MQYGFCTNIAFLDGDETSRVVFEGLVETGYDYVELPLSILSARGDIGELKKRLADANLPCRACNLFFPPALTLVGENQDKAGIEAYLQKVLPFAAEMGVETLVFGNGGARKIPPGATREATFVNLRTLVETMEKYASQTPVKICVELLNTTETDMINSYAQAVELTNGLKHVAAMIDSYHFLVEKHDYAAVLAHPHRMWHVHTAYSAQRLIPGPNDNKAEYAELQSTLKKLNYDGKISVEGGFRTTAPAEIKKEIKDALSMMKALF